MLQNSFYAILGTFYTLLNNTDLYLSYFILSYVFLGHNDSVEWGLTHSGRLAWKSFLSTIDAPPGSSGVSNEAKSFTKHATGGLVC